MFWILIKLSNWYICRYVSSAGVFVCWVMLGSTLFLLYPGVFWALSLNFECSCYVVWCQQFCLWLLTVEVLANHQSFCWMLHQPQTVRLLVVFLEAMWCLLHRWDSVHQYAWCQRQTDLWIYLPVGSLWQYLLKKFDGHSESLITAIVYCCLEAKRGKSWIWEVVVKLQL